jgi:hypothetical protein
MTNHVHLLVFAVKIVVCPQKVKIVVCPQKVPKGVSPKGADVKRVRRLSSQRDGSMRKGFLAGKPFFVG